MFLDLTLTYLHAKKGREAKYLLAAIGCVRLLRL
jgi:hypothetical protein